ncbi:carbohydrate-binding module family 13 protein [Collybiopsis luxurians FD-317 M1]|uniref:Carbohydrate-binding module family 13 protein n=1 Tax=Collybiopsis luxurians FD-317 M1 TaxID=944289 RepID=A0A0D0CJL7_9AGAR|nr:carbohydrate-binding module family 13 protein [Collybiopsis luxurians FD-317 M1]
MMHLTKLLFFLFTLTVSALAAVTPRAVVPRAEELIQSGRTFTIINAKAGTVVDLSAGDNTTSTGWTPNNGLNQRWTTLWTGHSWNFQSVITGSYLGISGTAANGANLTVSTTPTDWDIWHDTVNVSNYRIYIPNTAQNWDLWDFGNPVAGDPITLWQATTGVHQTWTFEQVDK